MQSTLLEAMQERQVSIQGETFMLDSPFLVLATQNPLETEGTYKLHEAQVDRFSFILTGKAHALLNGRSYVIPEDIKAVVHDVLKHRIILTYEADAEGIISDQIIDMLVANIKAP